MNVASRTELKTYINMTHIVIKCKTLILENKKIKNCFPPRLSLPAASGRFRTLDIRIMSQVFSTVLLEQYSKQDHQRI
jgi:hypothetical protein